MAYHFSLTIIQNPSLRASLRTPRRMTSNPQRFVRRPFRRRRTLCVLALVAISSSLIYVRFRVPRALGVPLAPALEPSDIQVSAILPTPATSGEDVARERTIALDVTKPVFASFVSNGFHEFMSHWHASLAAVGVTSNVIIAALDDATEAMCVEENIPHYSSASLRYTHEVMATGGTPLHDVAQTKRTTNDARAFQQIGALKAGFLTHLLKLGHDVLVSDVDVTWMRDPRAWLRETLREADLDVATSTDCLLATRWDDKSCWSTPFNTGILYLKPTAKTLEFLEEWRVKLETTENKIEHDQDIFNRMLRSSESAEATSLGPSNDVQVKSMGEGLKMKVGLLSMRLFASGHGYFVQRLHEREPKFEPFAVHTTFQFSQARGKRQRLREAMLWKVDKDAYYTDGNFIAMSDELPIAWRKAGIENHLVAAAWYRLATRNLLALGKILNRAVILPKVTCMCDRYWGFVLPSCSIGDYPPPYDRCPLDHIININALEKGGVPFREWSFLNNSRTPDAVKNSVARVRVQLAKSRTTGNEAYAIEPFSLDREIIATLGAAAERVLVVDSAVESFCAFEDDDATKTFDALMWTALEAESHTCGPSGCFVGFPRPHATATYTSSCEILRREHSNVDPLSTLGKFYAAFGHDRNGVVTVDAKSFAKSTGVLGSEKATSKTVINIQQALNVESDGVNDDNPFSAPAIDAEISSKKRSRAINPITMSIEVKSTPTTPQKRTADGGRYESLTEALAGIGARAGKDVVFIAFANQNVEAMTMNWATHLKAAADASASKGDLKFIVAALDVQLLDALRAQGVAAYPALHENLNHAADHANDNWKSFCRLMISQLKELLDAGYDAVLSDIDVVWLRDAAPYFKCDDNIDGCAAIKAADVMISSDNLSPSSDEEKGAMYARGGIFNTGMMFLRHSQNGKDFLVDWLGHLSAESGRFARLTTHQQVMNMMSRKPDSWPGLDPIAEIANDVPTRVLQSGSPLSTGQPFKLGVLPLKFFMNGHGYFISMAKRRAEFNPYAVHATYTFDGSGGDAKRYRFQEVGLWTESMNGSHVDEKYVTFDATPPKSLTSTFSGEPNIGDHIAVFKANLEILRDAIAVAVALNRTLAMPPMPCYCDKVWGGHDNIFTFRCHYPGSAEENYLPSTCPLDHFISPARLRDAGLRFIPVASVRSRATPIESDGMLERNRTLAAIIAAAKSASESTFIDVGDIRGIARDFPDESSRVSFDRFAAGVVPERWCSECHPAGCANLIPPATLALGRVSPTRITFDKFCVEFT